MSLQFQCLSCFVWRARIGCTDNEIQKKKEWQPEERWTARTIPGKQRGVFYTKRTLTEQSGVLRQRGARTLPAPAQKKGVSR